MSRRRRRSRERLHPPAWAAPAQLECPEALGVADPADRMGPPPDAAQAIVRVGQVYGVALMTRLMEDGLL